jgi:DNA-binding NarL/FixJ family response regulator
MTGDRAFRRLAPMDGAGGATAASTMTRTEPSVIRVVVADDQELVRFGLSSMLARHPGVEVVGEAADGEEAVELTTRLRPDVVLMDIHMPILDGLAATARLGEVAPASKVVIVTTFEDQEYLMSAITNGAVGFLLKDAGSRQLYDAVEAAASGEALVSPSLTIHLLQTLRARRNPALRELPLSVRERDVVTSLAHGSTNTEIAAGLFISLSTVKAHLTNIQAKLGLRNRVEIARWAWRHGLIDDDAH